MLRSLYAVSQSRVTRCAVVLLFGTPSWSAWHAVVKSRVSHASTLSLTHSRLCDHATDMLGVVTEFFLPVLLFLAFPFSSFPLLLFLFLFCLVLFLAFSYGKWFQATPRTSHSVVVHTLSWLCGHPRITDRWQSVTHAHRRCRLTVNWLSSARR